MSPSESADGVRDRLPPAALAHGAREPEAILSHEHDALSAGFEAFLKIVRTVAEAFEAACAITVYDDVDAVVEEGFEFVSVGWVAEVQVCGMLAEIEVDLVVGNIREVGTCDFQDQGAVLGKSAANARSRNYSGEVEDADAGQ